MRICKLEPPEGDQWVRAENQSDYQLFSSFDDLVDLWVFNTTTILDALDVDQSELVRFSSGRIMTVKSYVFRADRLRNVAAFKAPQLLAGPVFVTEEVVERSKTLAGVGFRLLWEGSARAA